MIPVSDVAQSAQSNDPSQSQSQLIASVVAQQKVIAAQSSDSAGDSANNPSKDQRASDYRPSRDKQQDSLSDVQPDPKADTQTRSIIEAQESASEDKIKAAFATRRDMHELLSVIRDPHDKLLPNDPADLIV